MTTRKSLHKKTVAMILNVVLALALSNLAIQALTSSNSQSSYSVAYALTDNSSSQTILSTGIIKPLEAEYIIWTDGTNCYAQNGNTSQIDYASTNASYVINSAAASLSGESGTIFFKDGTYDLGSSYILINFTLNQNILLEGETYKGVVIRGMGNLMLSWGNSQWVSTNGINAATASIENLEFLHNVPSNSSITLDIGWIPTNLDHVFVASIHSSPYIGTGINYWEAPDNPAEALWQNVDVSFYSTNYRIGFEHLSAIRLASYYPQNIGYYFTDGYNSHFNDLYCMIPTWGSDKVYPFYFDHIARGWLGENFVLESGVNLTNTFLFSNTKNFWHVPTIRVVEFDKSGGQNTVAPELANVYEQFNVWTRGVNYVTENWGTSQISSGTSITFPHGLSSTPSAITITWQTLGWGSYAVSSNSQNITVTVSTQGTYSFYWQAKISSGWEEGT